MDVVIHGLSKSFGQVHALKPTHLVVQQGKFTTLLGPSGCGKTTLLRLIAGLEIPDAGEIHIGEESIYSKERKINKPVHRRGFGMVFQDFALWPHLTVFENVAFGLRAAKTTKELKQRVQDAINRVRLQGMEHRYPDQLSGGQQQRVSFARAVVTKPRLVLFDEPLSALDAVLREEMRVELMSLVHQMGLTALYVTHDQIEAMSMSDEIVVMQEGQILQKGDAETVYQRPNHPFVARFIGKSNWIEPNRAMIRPEHVRFTSEHGDDNSYAGMIITVSYVGERYEMQLDMGPMGLWSAYHHTRLQAGEKVQIYVSPQHIHHIQTN
ncbi:MAG: transporter ATP-binding protein [Paenibacillus sp.]|nr:transporter ATP-binding protein [Paenibacillus sp.]